MRFLLFSYLLLYYFLPSDMNKAVEESRGPKENTNGDELSGKQFVCMSSIVYSTLDSI